MEQPAETATQPPSAEGKFSALPARIGSALALVAVAGGAWYLGGIVWQSFI